MGVAVLLRSAMVACWMLKLVFPLLFECRFMDVVFFVGVSNRRMFDAMAYVPSSFLLSLMLYAMVGVPYYLRCFFNDLLRT